MLLKKLETRGFKSFAEKLTIEFGRGITAIVGPNGSGKSNITDAIRWVLGEQNMRTLRGAKSEDIIFSGTSEGRRPLGMAEVAITLDNSDRQIPLDYSEIEIMRRVFRSGENEYYLNRTACRLKDIQEILFGTGMGKNNLSVIGQNKVDEILGSKPEERRLIFEEAAGIAKYKQRKKESLRKLADTNQNLVRIEDITTEIAAQLPLMKQKAQNTEKYLALAEQRTRLREMILLARISESEEAMQAVEREQHKLRCDSDDLAAEMTIFDAKQMKRKDEAVRQEETIAEREKMLDLCRTQWEQITGQVAILTERIGQNHTRMTLLREEVSRLASDGQTAKAQIERLRTEADELREKRTVAEAKSVAAQVQGDQLAETIRQSEESIESLQQEMFAFRQQISLAEEKLRHRTEIDRTFDEWQMQWQSSLAESEASLVHADEELACLAEEDKRLTTLREELSLAQKTTQAQFTQVSEEIRTLKMRRTEQEKRYHAVHSRYTVLASMQKEYEGFSRAGKEILSRRQGRQEGVYGAVAELIKMTDEVVVAIETALGASLQNIVVDTEQTAQKLIAYLKQNRLGRATFLPLSSLQIYAPREQDINAAREVGAVGLASELVTCEAKYRPIVEFLLNRSVVVRTLDDAVHIARKYRFRVRLITLDGDVMNSGGSMTGGSRIRKEAGFLSRSVEIDTLAQEEIAINHAQSQIEKQLKEIMCKQEYLIQKQNELSERQRRWQQNANALHIAREKAQFTRSRLAETIRERKAEGLARIEARRNEADIGTELAGKIDRWQAKLTAAEKQFAETTAKRSELVQLRERQTQASVELQVVLSSLGEREQYLRQEQAQLNDAINQYHLREQTIRQELAELEKIADEQMKEKENCISEQKVKQDLLALLTAEKESLQKERLALLRQLQDDEQTEKAYRRQAKELADKTHRVELQYAKQQYERTRNLEALEELGLTSFKQLQDRVGTYEAVTDDTELIPILRKVERAIQALGPVNPSAVEEYRELEERYTFLAQQQADLTEAQTYLTDVIAQIDRVMEKNFTEAFRAIDAHFRTIFARIFGGGQARLELTNNGDMLTTGIEIIAQPPGKKQQNMVLLSGGERALTVIALLFAFLEYRPMPFTVVDEIDAPLDEANLERFVTFLKEFAEHTQFIIITHRKVTMRAADVMLGVTNEDAGVSRIISVKLEDTE